MKQPRWPRCRSVRVVKSCTDQIVLPLDYHEGCPGCRFLAQCCLVAENGAFSGSYQRSVVELFGCPMLGLEYGQIANRFPQFVQYC